MDVRPKTPQEIVDPRATAFGLIEESAVAEARFPSAGGTQAEEAGSIEAMVVSAVSRARDLGEQLEARSPSCFRISRTPPRFTKSWATCALTSSFAPTTKSFGSRSRRTGASK